MRKNVFTRALKPATLGVFAASASVAASAMLAGTPAFAADHEAQKPATQASAQSVLKIAESQIGVTENAAGGGTPFHSWYMSSQRAKETIARDGGSVQAYANAPWCAMFVSWVGEKAGARQTVGWDAYTVTWAKWFQANKKWGTLAKPGAVVFYDWNGKSTTGIDHMGLVKQDNGNGTITTIEGNTGNGKVEQRIRPKSQVVGYGYPEYKA
ncbi:CHAP domain-containing protein [[Actinomadura] parvosata subsp. kistnae]|uniref:CHAP domain-containing protein n=1 Tax=[Actinomadura] parvosata subsp. kistnae TaxID=1909395 RepID=A0A1U9ZYR9_9ACTN|nr:CHAP domain-containing protein [Nonomuraea sp. ATCC 55076]AQZ63094.1 CHAP domain-containing protein [Nonomuraea sp. ATCC 55076]